jgi:4-hydroxy-3-methylbut-2-enyl diphosphate reductase
VYVRHEIVHNRHVVAALAERGAIFVENTDEVPPGSVVVFSAHGVSPAVREVARKRRLQVIDATCPLVTKVHNEARRFAAATRHPANWPPGHEEVEGTFGEAPANVHIVDGDEAVNNIVVRDESKLIWLSQTTLSVDETMTTVERLRQRFPLLEDPPSDDICYATQNRQVAVKALAPHSDLIIVVGSENSSNSIRLVEVARRAGVRNAYRVDDASEIDLGWLDEALTVGVTSGASVPEILVRGVLMLLSKNGFENVQTISTTQETVVFAQPRELRI